MTVIKRDGTIEKFSKQKIIDSIKKANSSLDKEFQITSKQISRIAIAVATSCLDLTEPINIDKIEDLVEEKMMETQAFELAKSYIKFRYRKISTQYKLCRSINKQSILTILYSY